MTLNLNDPFLFGLSTGIAITASALLIGNCIAHSSLQSATTDLSTEDDLVAAAEAIVSPTEVIATARQRRPSKGLKRSKSLIFNQETASTIENIQSKFSLSGETLKAICKHLTSGTIVCPHDRALIFLTPKL
jgi:hypothetical protein